jgi:hypothetical protein
MKSNWLSSRLTKSKQASTMWVTLADSIQASFASTLDGIVDTITSNRSVMTMSVDEVKRKQESLGHFFSVLDVPDTEKNLTLLTRLDQIHLKATEFPIKDMVRRNFDGLEMDWSPVYAPIDQEEYPYGTRLIAQAEFDNLDSETQDYWFMTSRGRMILNLNKYLPPEEEMNRIYNSINETIIPMIPLDIVFDGFFTQVKIKAVFDVHSYTNFDNPISDTFKVSYDVERRNKVTEDLKSSFDVEQDYFSIDSTNRNERLAYQDRDIELLGEQPLGLLPLGASYTRSGNSIEAESIASDSLVIGDKWKSTEGLPAPSGRSFITQPATSNLYHLLNCVVGERYAVSVRKENNARTRFIISASNNTGGEVKEVFGITHNRAEYGATFQATNVAMYIVIDLDVNEATICSDISVKKLTAI